MYIAFHSVVFLCYSFNHIILLNNNTHCNWMIWLLSCLYVNVVQECELCEDPNLCRTGVCIGCDAGLCKTFFHASWYVWDINFIFLRNHVFLLCMQSIYKISCVCYLVLKRKAYYQNCLMKTTRYCIVTNIYLYCSIVKPLSCLLLYICCIHINLLWL